jgi:hypothetical protein
MTTPPRHIALTDSIPSKPESTQPIPPEWRNSDPRIDFVDLKRVDIVILRPSLKGKGLWDAGMGYCEMKHGWSITTTFDEHKYVSEDEDWDKAWLWIPAPQKTT